MMATILIKSIEEINLIKTWYKKKGQLQNLLIFILSTNTGIELTYLLDLKIKDVKDKLYLSLKKQHSMPLNDEILELVNLVIKGRKVSDYLFVNTRANKCDRVTVLNCFKNVCTELGLSENYSISSWRKTFVYHFYEKYKDISYLMWLFNQNTTEVALKFIDVKENMNLRFRDGVSL